MYGTKQGNVKHEPLFSALADALKASFMLGVTLSSVAIVIRSAKDSSIRSFKQTRRIMIFSSHALSVPGDTWAICHYYSIFSVKIMKLRN